MRRQGGRQADGDKAAESAPGVYELEWRPNDWTVSLYGFSGAPPRYDVSRHVTEGQSSPVECRIRAVFCVLSVYDYECVVLCCCWGESLDE